MSTTEKKVTTVKVLHHLTPHRPRGYGTLVYHFLEMCVTEPNLLPSIRPLFRFLWLNLAS